MKNLEQLQAAEDAAFRNYMVIKDECATKVEAASQLWIRAMQAVADQRSADDITALRQSIRKEIEQEKAVNEPATSQPAA
jgi:hypothetical protein